MTITVTRDVCPSTLTQPQEQGQKRDFHKRQNILMSPLLSFKAFLCLKALNLFFCWDYAKKTNAVSLFLRASLTGLVCGILEPLLSEGGTSPLPRWIAVFLQ